MEDYEDRGGMERFIIPAIVLACIAGGVWYLMSQSTGIHRSAPPVDTIIATLPPPPPPPPPRPPEPEKRNDVPKPVDEPKPVDMPHPMTINGPAQSGTDAFNIGAGDGTGTVGSGAGFGEATYSQYMGHACEQALQQDNDVNRMVFTAEADVWADPNGHITRVQVVQTSGDPKADSAVEHDCALSLAESPPAAMRFPQRMRIRSARPA